VVRLVLLMTLQSTKPDDSLTIATVAADICANLDPLPISGVVYVAAVPYIGPIMPRLDRPGLQPMRAGFTRQDDTALFRHARIFFVDALFAEPDRVPSDVKWSWLGSTLLQNTDDFKYVATRRQDPTKLFELGTQGLPLLIVQGTADKLLLTDVVEEEMRTSFTNMDVRMIEGGSHALFYDNQEEFVGVLLEFVKKRTSVS
jgi:pimeloyl-ACP methyl ester carboxylesterase